MLSPATSTITAAQARFAMWMLVFATMFWGASFTWAKNLGEAFNTAAGLGLTETFGPMCVLSIRFAIAGVLWVAIFPSARVGWSVESVKHCVIIALLFAAGMVLQMLGLSHTTEAVSAFLTGLTVVFVPLILTVASRKLPSAKILIAILLAMSGVWLMTGAAPTGFGLGEVLGLSCAIVFSFGLIALNHYIPKDSPWRITTGMFFGISLGCTLATLYFMHGHTVDWTVFAKPKVISELSFLTIFSTVVAFGIMNIFQPRVDVTRASIIYLIEPIAAALFAWAINGRAMAPLAMVGAVLILLANVVAEMKWGRKSA